MIAACTISTTEHALPGCEPRSSMRRLAVCLHQLRTAPKPLMDSMIQLESKSRQQVAARGLQPARAVYFQCSFRSLAHATTPPVNIAQHAESFYRNFSASSPTSVSCTLRREPPSMTSAMCVNRERAEPTITTQPSPKRTRAFPRNVTPRPGYATGSEVLVK
jgi:hypothetical protein